MLMTDMQEKKQAKADIDSLHRLCIACRQKSEPSSLLRFVRAADGTLVFDVRGHAHFRGAYVCANAACLGKALQRKAFFRAFDKPMVSVDLAALSVEIKSALCDRVLENLGLAFRTGQCLVGRTKIAQEGASKPVIAWIVSHDLSSRSCRELGVDVDNADLGIAVLRGPDKRLMGHALGRTETGVVALLKGRISDRIICDLTRFLSLGSFSQVGE